MRILLLCAQTPLPPGDSVATALGELGCRVEIARFDLGDLDRTAIQRKPPSIIVVEAGDELARANPCRKALSQHDLLADTPTLLLVTVPQLPALDFSIGFHDFALMPVVPPELYARLRQLDWKTSAFGSEEVIKLGDLLIDLAGYEVHLAGRKLDLTPQEFELLRFLASHRGRAFTRDQLLTRVWGYSYGGGTRTVDIHVRRVRAKLGMPAADLIETVRNVGYKMRTELPAPGEAT